MELFHKIHIHFLTYIIILISLLCGLFKYVIIISIIFIVHETGHIISMIIFKRKIATINILPIGGLIKLDSKISSNIIEDIIISISGIATQLLLAIILVLLRKYQLINNKLFEMFSYYNKLIIWFNLLPICPLDGYKILKLLIEIFIPYKLSFNISLIISLIIFILNINIIEDNLFIGIFLLYIVYKEFYNRKYLLNKFYLERALWDFKYKICYINKETNMYKNRTHIIHGINEKEYLKNKYFIFY